VGKEGGQAKHSRPAHREPRMNSNIYIPLIARMTIRASCRAQK